MINVHRLVILAFCVAVGPVGAQVYKHVRPDGSVVYSDRPPAEASRSVEVNPGIRSRAARPEEDPMHAAMRVYGGETMVETFYRFCRDTVPESEPALRSARDRWNERHRQLMASKLVVLKDQLSISELRKLAAETEAAHLEILAKVRMAPKSDHAAWCHAAPDRYEAPEINPVRDPTIVRTLESYKPRRGSP